MWRNECAKNEGPTKRNSPEEHTMTRKARAKSKPPALPHFAGGVAERHPDLWKAYQLLGKAASECGPLNAREQRLVKLALAIGAGSEGSCHSHTRRALAEKLPADALEHVALLAITSLGWAKAMRGLAWIEDVTSSSRSRLPE